MKKPNTLLWALLAVCAVNLLVHLFFYASMPERVPIHWNFNGVADGYVGKPFILLLAVLPVGALGLMALTRRIDPRSKNFARFEGVWKLLVVSMTVSLVALSWLPALAVWGVLPDGSNLLSVLVCGGVGLLLIVLGNYLPRVRQNYTFGCRTPWALADEHNWNRTQRMGGIVFVAEGAVLLAVGLFSALLGQIGALALIVGGVLGGTLWIYAYSYLVYRGKMK